LAVRLNQETLEVAVQQITSGSTHGNDVRVNQAAILLGTNGEVSPGNVRLNQLTFLFLAPAELAGAKVQLIGGPFQDALGNPLSNGYLVMQLQHDAVALNTGQIVGNASVRIPLDINGYIQGTVTGAPLYIWPNDILSPSGGNYIIWAYDSVNRLVWDNPQIQQVLSTTNPFNANVWVPGP
jgi:hypothetical protein